MSKPVFEPVYRKPDEPGITMNFDNSVSLYHVVQPEDTFAQAAQAVFAMIQEAQSRYPGWPRVLYLDIDGHAGQSAGFDDDFLEFQQELLFSTMAPFLTAFETPLTGGLVNPEPQRDDIPDELILRDSL
jgi:hypothetical protein